MAGFNYGDDLLGGPAPGRRPAASGGGSSSGYDYGEELLGGGLGEKPKPKAKEDEGPGFLSRTASAIGRTLYNTATPGPLIEDIRDIAQQGVQSSDQFPYFRLPESIGKRHEETSQSARDIAPFALGGPAGGALRTGAGAVARRIGGEAAGASVAEAGKQAIEQGSIDPASVAATGALGAAGGAAGEAVGVGLNRYLNRHVAPDIGRADFNETNRLRALAEEQGIQLTPAELTNLPSLKAEQKMLGNLPQSGDTIADFQRMRADEQIEPAIQRYLDSLGEQFGDEASGELTRAAANRAQQTIAQTRADQARPLYQQAFAEAKPADTSKLLSGLRNQISKAPEGGEIRKTLSRVETLLQRSGFDAAGNPIKTPVSDIETLHMAKVEIDQMLEGVNPENRVGSTTKARLQSVKTDLLEAIETSSPTYADARAIFADLSPGVARVREGVAGTIADLPDQQLRTVAARLFDKAKISPRAAGEARAQLQGADPDAWQAIKRSYIEDAWIKATEEGLTSGGPPVSAGAKFRKRLLGNGKQRQILQRVLEPDEFSALNDLSTVLEASARVKPIGSDTAWNQEMVATMKRNGRGHVSRVLGAADPRVLSRISDEMDARGFENYTQELAEAITTPGGIDFIRQLRQASPNNRFRAAVLGYALGVGTTKDGANPNGETEQPPAEPPQAQQGGDPGGMAQLGAILKAQGQEAKAQNQAILEALSRAPAAQTLKIETTGGQQAPLQGHDQRDRQGISQEGMIRMQELEQAQQAQMQQMAEMAEINRQMQENFAQQMAVFEKKAASSEQPASVPTEGPSGAPKVIRKRAAAKRDDGGNLIGVDIEEEDEAGNRRARRATIERDEFGRFVGLESE